MEYTESMLNMLAVAKSFLERSAVKDKAEEIPKVSVRDVLDELTVPNQNPAVVKAKVQCPCMRDKNMNVMVVASAPAGDERNGGLGLRETDIKLIPNTFGYCNRLMQTCHPVIVDNRWKGCSESDLIDGEASVNMYSYMICGIGGGYITLKADGQRAGGVRKIYWGHDFTKVLEIIKNLEIDPQGGAYILDENDIPVAIDIQNVKDGCITIGYGHILQTEEDIEKYGFGEWKEEILGNIKALYNGGNLPYDNAYINNIIKMQKEKMERAGIDNPAILPINEAEEILMGDVKERYLIALKQGFGFTDNQIDALTCNIFNAGTKHMEDPDALQFHFKYLGEKKKDNDGDEFIVSQESALAIIKEAENRGWYKNQEGLFRRRLMEYNIYFNGAYDYYDYNHLEDLKKAVKFDDGTSE